MEQKLTGYLLNALTEREMREVEEYLAQHPEARETLAQLQAAIAPLAADSEAPAPPPGLAVRTLAKVAEHLCADKNAPSELPRAPDQRSTPSFSVPMWRRVDVLVAACLLLTFVGLSLITLRRMRGPTSAVMLAECKNNLRQFFIALHAYRDLHGEFPDISKEAPRNVAGMVVPILADGGALPSSASIRCPGLGSPLACHLTLDALRKMSDEEFEQRTPCLSMCYAYSLGYRDANGVYHAPADSPKEGWSQIPIMADRPPAEGVLTNSINHAGVGQNVLFADGSVLFMPQRTRGDDDIFVNRDKRVAAGLDLGDIVLGYSSSRP
jgi:hypothetical protein